MNDEQQMLRDSAERYLRDNYDFAARQAIADQGIGIDEQHWQNFVAMGWTAMSFTCLLYTSPSPRDQRGSRMPSSA